MALLSLGYIVYNIVYWLFMRKLEDKIFPSEEADSDRAQWGFNKHRRKLTSRKAEFGWDGGIPALSLHHHLGRGHDIRHHLSHLAKDYSLLKQIHYTYLLTYLFTW